jgi:predicted N-acetyltransferase YhbS
MFDIRAEGPEDGPAIETLLDASFGPERLKKTSYRYRFGVAPVASLALSAELDGRLVGSIRFWPVRLDSAPALLLGPLAVDPALHGAGIGRALVRTSLAKAAGRGPGLVFLVGEPAYYRQFGFTPVPPGIVMPGEDPARLQWLGLMGVLLPQGGGRLLRVDGGDLREPGRERLPDVEHVLVA